MGHMLDHVSTRRRRPKQQWWMQLRPVVRAVAEEPGA